MLCKGCDYENIPARGDFVAIRVLIAHFRGNTINWKKLSENAVFSLQLA